MRQAITCSDCGSLDTAAPRQTDSRSHDPDVTRWRALLDTLVGAPVRLHRYRHLHAEVIDDALRAYDCGPARRDRP